MRRAAKSGRPLRDVLGYENERVLRDFLIRFHLDRSEGLSLFPELLKLLWLSNAHGVPSSYPVILHELWRELVVHTEEYERFCARYFGRLLHHDPGALVHPRLARSDAELEAAIGLVYATLGQETASLWYGTLVGRYPPEFFENVSSSAMGLGRRRWEHYSANAKPKPPTAVLLGALRRFERRPLARRRFAIDLGCGTGRDTRELLARGWRVLAIDSEPSALAALLDATPPDQRERLTMSCARFERLEVLPRCDLVNASLSLPFCPPDGFPRLWSVIVRAIRRGGRFAGDFLGETDAWASQPRMTSHSVAAVRELLAALRIERLRERRSIASSLVEGPKRWHVISVIAKRSAMPPGGSG